MTHKPGSFASFTACEDIASSTFLVDGSIVDSRQPENLTIVLKEHFGPNLENCLKDQKLLLIELICFALRNGKSFSEIADQWNVEGLLPIPVAGSDLDCRSAIQLLQELTAGLAD